MIRIYTDDLSRIELHLRGEDVEIASITNRPDGAATVWRARPASSPASKPRIDIVAAALLVAIGAGGGYLLAARHSGAATPPVADAVAAPWQQTQALPIAPSGVPPLVQRELQERPSVTRRPAAPSSPSGPAAFGLQP